MNGQAQGRRTHEQETYGGRMDETTAGAGASRGAAGRGTGDLSRCADLAGVRLYRRNAFAVTGLPADAQGRAVRQHRQRLETRLAVEETWQGAADSPLVGGHRKDEVRAAFEEFQDPRRRLVDELLWQWGEADLGCGCPLSVHGQHDMAVRYHARVLDAETGYAEMPTDVRDSFWRTAARTWERLVQLPEFRRHIAHRIRVLDDPRLGEHSADDFLAEIPGLLMSPFRELAMDPAFGPRLGQVCADWAEYEVFAELFPELFAETVQEAIQRITDGLGALEAKQSAKQYEDAVLVLRQQILPAFDRLTGLRAFVADWRYEEAAHMVSVGFNNLAVALQGHYVGRTPTAQQRRTVIELAEKAYEVAPESDAAAIKGNWDVIYAQFTGSGPIPGSAGGRAPSPRRDCAVGLLVLLGLVGLVVQAFVVGFGTALATGFFGLMAIGFISVVVERIRVFVNWIRDIM